MLNVMREYLAECQRQRITPYEGFIHHLSTNTIDCDIDSVPIQTIRVFSMALCNSHHRRHQESDGSASCRVGGRLGRWKGCGSAYSSSNRVDSARGVARSGGSSSANVLSRMGSPSLTTPPPPLPRTMTVSSPVKGERGGGRLACLRLRCGRACGARGGGAGGTGAASPTQRSSLKGPRFFGAAPPPPSPMHKAREGCDITSPSHRAVLRMLIDGLSRVVEDSNECLLHFQLSGFPLGEVGESARRLLRALSGCKALRTLSLSNSFLSPELFSTLTAFSLADDQGQRRQRAATPCASSSKPVSQLPPPPPPPRVCLPSLTEADFSGCGLTDRCARTLQFLIGLGGEQEGLAFLEPSRRRERDSNTRSDGANSELVACGRGVTVPTAKGLQRLDVSENALSDGALMGIARVTREHSTLRTLDFSRNQVTAKGFLGFLASGVLENSGLDVVDISRNPCCYHDPTSVGGGGGGCAVGVALPFPLPQLPYHQCIAGGLGQLLILRERTEDHPASKQARRSPGQLSIQTGGDNGREKERERELSSFVSAPLQPQQQQQEKGLPRGEGASPSGGGGGAAAEAPAAASPVSAPPAHPLGEMCPPPFRNNDSEADGGQANPSPQPRSQNTEGPPQSHGQPPQPLQGGHAPTQQYALPPSSYILPVYQPFPPPNLFQPPAFPQHCYHCCHCCIPPHHQQQGGRGHPNHESDYHHHHHSSASVDRRQQHHHHHYVSPNVSFGNGDDRPPPYSHSSGVGQARAGVRANHPDAGRPHPCDETSVNAVSALTSPEEESFAMRKGGNGSSDMNPRTDDHHRRRRHAIQLGPLTTSPKATRGDSPPSTVATEGEGKEVDKSMSLHSGSGNKEARDADTRQKEREKPFDPFLAGPEDSLRAGEEDHPLTAATLLSQQQCPSTTATDDNSAAAVMATAIVREVSDTLQAYLQHQQSLVERMVHEFDNYEVELTEKLEKHQQQSTGRLDAFRKDLLARMEKLSAEQKAAAEAAAREREARAEPADPSSNSPGEDATKKLQGGLVDLMQCIMKQVEERVEHAADKDSGSDKAAKQAREREQRRRVGGLLSSATGAEPGEAAKRQVFLSTASAQLKALGW